MGKDRVQNFCQSVQNLPKMVGNLKSNSSENRSNSLSTWAIWTETRTHLHARREEQYILRSICMDPSEAIEPTDYQSRVTRPPPHRLFAWNTDRSPAARTVHLTEHRPCNARRAYMHGCLSYDGIHGRISSCCAAHMHCDGFVLICLQFSMSVFNSFQAALISSYIFRTKE